MAFMPAMGEAVSPQLQVALGPLLSALETITERIREYDAQMEELAEKGYPGLIDCSRHTLGCRNLKVQYASPS
jgi:hypothetical protein